mmetsp:Transcript_28281/g.32951  ORF Transcript_28281/g.32951 Transcript_28281/m.32951 type:complete len:101 (+) Transcript_28281:750-1052(+)
MYQYKGETIEVSSPMQYGCGVEAGGTQLITQLNLHLGKNPDHVAVCLDVENAYNELMRNKILQFIWNWIRNGSNSNLRELMMYFFQNLCYKVIHWSWIWN